MRERDKRYEENEKQRGFIKEYSSIDHISVIKQILENVLCKKICYDLERLMTLHQEN